MKEQEYIRYTIEEWEALPLETRRNLLVADSERKDLETALCIIGREINKTKEAYIKSAWKTIRDRLDRDFGPKLIIEHPKKPPVKRK